jgi:hypothetical protein
VSYSSAFCLESALLRAFEPPIGMVSFDLGSKQLNSFLFQGLARSRKTAHYVRTRVETEKTKASHLSGGLPNAIPGSGLWASLAARLYGE